MKQLPLSSLIERLQSEGFSIDARTILQLQEVLLLLGREYLHTPHELYKVLSPIIAKNEGEQAKFKQIFEEYYSQIHKLAIPSEGEIVAPIEDDKKFYISKKLKYTLLLIGSLFLALLVYLFFTTILPQNQRPSAYFSFTPSYDIRPGDTIAFLNQSTQKEGITYQWEFGNGDYLLSQDSIIRYTYAKENTYTVRLLARNKEGLDSLYTQLLFVEDSCKPQPKFTYVFSNKYIYIGSNKYIYIGDTILFYNNTANKAWLRFTWDFGDSSKLLTNDSITSYVYPKGGDFTVRLTAKNAINACEETFSQTITVRASRTTTEMVIVPLSIWEKPVIYWWVLLLGMALWAVVEFYFYYKARNPLSKKKEKAFKEKLKVSDKRPYAIPFPNKESAIALERDFYDLSNELRTREEGERQSLHLLATLHQTIKKGGFPTIIHKVNSKPSEYLFLIEKTKANNQQYQLFEAFTRLLQNEGVLIDKFVYQQDLSLCWNDKYMNGIRIETLAQNFPTHHLIIIGKGEGFFQELGTEIDREKIHLLDSWKDRILLTPIYPEHWTYQEKLLQAHFTLLPATMNGWLDLMEALLNEEQADFSALQQKYWHKHSTAIARGGLAHPQAYPKDRDWDLPMLKTYLNDPQLLAWVCAVAVYPKPTWEITLAIGEAIDHLDEDKTFLVTYANLFTIAQLPWLQSGNLPPQLREVLLAELHTQPDIERLAYQTLADLLAQLSIPENSLASREKEIQMVLADYYLGKVEQENKEILYYLYTRNMINDIIDKQNVENFFAKQNVEINISTKKITAIREIALNMVYIEGGSFQMGCTSEQKDCYDDEKPVHSVTVKTFQMSKYEITNAQYAQFLNEYGSDKVKSGQNKGQKMVEEYKLGVTKVGGLWQAQKGYENYPVVYVTWYGANEFCKHYGGRLPTEEEWEYAACGGNKSKGYLYAGSNTIGDVAWYTDNSGSKTHPVGQKSPNELGLYDLSGNVWEWTASGWSDNYEKPRSSVKYVLRGGSWYYYNYGCRVAYRGGDYPTIRSSGVGFRLAMDF